ncbi:SPOR domain-containing protein, partial [Acidomonas methanolica]
AAAPSAAAPAAAAPQPDGKFMVQLAALDSAAEAHRQWDTLQHQAPELFGTRAPLIETVTREGRTYYRLRLRGFESVAAARAFCIKAHARSIACTPAQF